MNLVMSTFDHMRPTVMLVNIPEFDWPLGHVDGGTRAPTIVRQLMQGFDRDLGHLEDAYHKAGILNQTLFVFTSDHGMAPIDHMLPSSAIEQAVEKAGTGISSAPAPLMDIAPTILTLLGVTPAGMQGVPLTEALPAPTSSQQASRTAQIRTLTPVIAALSAESRAEVAAGQ
jgi:arylsulfatase A-like enzyme